MVLQLHLRAQFHNPVVRDAEELHRAGGVAKQAGEEYDPDGDEDYIFMDDPDQSGESEVFERKRTFQRRDLTGEFIRLTTLIANLERQLLQSSKIKVEIEMIRKGEKQVDDVEQLTDIELDAELQKLIGGLSV